VAVFIGDISRFAHESGLESLAWCSRSGSTP
jgi:hypothetical protein